MPSDPLAIIRAHRAADPRTDYRICKDSGLSPVSLAEVLNGNRARPSFMLVESIMRALGMKWGDLDGETK